MTYYHYHAQTDTLHACVSTQDTRSGFIPKTAQIVERRCKDTHAMLLTDTEHITDERLRHAILSVSLSLSVCLSPALSLRSLITLSPHISLSAPSPHHRHDLCLCLSLSLCLCLSVSLFPSPNLSLSPHVSLSDSSLPHTLTTITSLSVCLSVCLFLSLSESDYLLSQYRFTRKLVLRCTVTNTINNRLIKAATKVKNTNTRNVLLSEH